MLELLLVIVGIEFSHVSGGSILARHRELPIELGDAGKSFGNRFGIWSRGAPRGASSFTAVLCKVEGEDALGGLGTLEHLRMAQRAYRVVEAGAPVVLHARPRELVILPVSFIF